MSEMMAINQIETRSPFKDLFMINSIVLQSIEDDMKKYGYDESAPIVVWEEGNVVIDGHTRLQAAKNIGLKEVFVQFGKFDEGTAMEYAVHNQRDRRNMTDAEILRCVEIVDKRRPVGRHPKDKENVFKVKNDASGAPDKENVFKVKNDANIPSHEQTAMTVGITPSKVCKVRTILDSKDDKIKQEVLAGKKSIHAASEDIKKKKIKDPLLVAHRQLEKDMTRAINEAVGNGIAITQIRQVVKEILKAKGEI